MSEQRVTRRNRTLKTGKVVLGSLFADIDCVVRNLSGTGACLVVASPMGIPDRFDLTLDGGKTSRRCRIAWRSEDKVGVAFEEPVGASLLQA